MFSFPYVNTLTWADILSEKLRPKTSDEFKLMNWNLKWWSWPLSFSIRITCLSQPIMHFITPLRRITKPPTTDHRQVFHQLPTHLQVFHRLTERSSTDSPNLLQLTNNPFTHQSYFHGVTIGPILSITNFNSSFRMGAICYWIRKIIYKMTDKKERW